MIGGGGMFNQTGTLGGLGTARNFLGGELGGAMFSQSSGLMGETSKAGMFSNTGTSLNLGTGLGNQVRNKCFYFHHFIHLWVFCKNAGIGTATGLMGQQGGLGGLGGNL